MMTDCLLLLTVDCAQAFLRRLASDSMLRGEIEVSFMNRREWVSMHYSYLITTNKRYSGRMSRLVGHITVFMILSATSIFVSPL